jgi:hypothetical protein
LEEIYDRLGDRPFSAEFKYDGQRAQIHGHFSDGKITVKIFSRHLEDMTSKVRPLTITFHQILTLSNYPLKYPDIVSMVERIFNSQPGITSFIMDSEIVAIDTVNGSLKSFQQLSNRARKDVQLKDIQVFVCVFAFDLMYLNGEVREIGVHVSVMYSNPCVRFCWNVPFGIDGIFCALIFRLSVHLISGLLDWITSKAVKVSKDGTASKSFGRKLLIVVARA